MEKKKDISREEMRYFELPYKYHKRGFDFYMYKLGNMFDRLECVSKIGSPLSGGGFQYIAYTKHLEGDDEVFDGYGDTPLEAVRDLYNNFKPVMDRYGKLSETGISQIFV